MINLIQGDLFTVKSGILVHGCNCVGAFGAGVALIVRNIYPHVHEEYVALCKQVDSPQDLLGRVQYVNVPTADGTFLIANAFTQLEPGTDYRRVDYEAVAMCFEDINDVLSNHHIAAGISDLTVSFPKIGAGLAGGSWDVIEKIIDVSVSDEFRKVLYVPGG